MKRLLAFWALVTVAHGTGTVQQSLQQLGQTNNWVLAYQWVGDSGNGTVPNTLAQGLVCCVGYLVVQVETVPGSPAPTAGYGVAIQDSSGVDVLNGAAGTLSASAPQSFAASTSAPPLQGALTLVVTGQNVASAKGTVYVFLSKPGSINVATIGRGAIASSANWLTLANSAFADVRTYNYTAQFPGGTLSPGACNFNMNPIPTGLVTGGSVYIQGGVGTAEALTNVTVSGANVSGTCANSHSGNWSAQSATAGAQEAASVSPNILFTDGTYNIFAQINLTGDATVLCTSDHANIKSNSATQNIFVSTTTTTLQRFAISNCQLSTAVVKTAGDAIQLNGTGGNANTAPVITDLLIVAQWNGIHSVSGSRVMITNVRIQDNVNFDIWLQNSINVEAGDNFITACQLDNSITTGTAIRMDTGAAVKIVGNKIQNHAIGLDIEVPDGTNQSQILLTGNSFDFSHTNPILMQRSASTGNIFGGSITGNYIGGDTVSPNCLTLGTGVNTMIVASNYFQNCATAGVAITGTAVSVQVQDNFFSGSVPTGITVGASAGVNYISNNFFGNVPVSFSASTIFEGLGTSFAFASLPTNVANGSQLFCSDCNATCTAGASTGRTCFRENSAWTH